jgi:solute carrier family 25 (adenine nucleotide translocator) protein 4/5/6/31
MVDAVKKIVKTDGIAGIYQGYGISLFGSIIYRLLYLGGYDACKAELVVWKRNQQQEKHRRKNEGASSARDGPNYDLYANSEDDSSNDLVAAYEAVPAVSLAWTELFWLAQFVSLASGTLCYPIDSVRRRMMMQAGKPLDERQYLTSMQCFWKIWTNEGLRGFYLGIGPNLFRSFGGALALVAYDGFKTILASNQ